MNNPPFTNVSILSVDLFAQIAAATLSGAQWGHAGADFNLTLLSWTQGDGVQAHVNNEIDVTVLALDGEGDAIVDGIVHHLGSGHLLEIPKGSERAFRATSARFSYLSLHRRRPPLMPVVGGSGGQS